MSAESSLLRAELRGETRLYALAALTTAFAAAALTLVLALADTFERSFASSARTLLGGDVSVRLRARDFSPPEEEWLRDNAAGVSFVRVAAVLAVADDNAQMTRVKIADSAYPLYGELKLQGGGDLQALLSAEDADGVYPAAVDTDFLELANLRPGDTFSAAGLTMRIAEVVTAEPDPDPRMWMAAPLILAGESAAAGGNFSGAGMLSSRFARVRLAKAKASTNGRRDCRPPFPKRAGMCARRRRQCRVCAVLWNECARFCPSCRSPQFSPPESESAARLRHFCAPACAPSRSLKCWAEARHLSPAFI